MNDLPPPSSPILPDATGSVETPPAGLPPPSAPVPPEVPPPSATPPPINTPDGGAESGPSGQSAMEVIKSFFASASARSPEIPGDENLRPVGKSENSLGILLHLLPTLGLLFVHVPFLNVVPPLGLWLYLRSDSRYIDEVGKEVVNFSIGVGAAMLVGMLVCGCFNPFIAIAGAVMAVVGALKASESKMYRYPLTLRLIK